MPVILTDRHRAALSELANVGFGRAAGSLSALTGQRITAHVPVLKFIVLHDFISQLAEGLPEEVVCVDQLFTGPISGNGLLIMDRPGAARLSTIVRIQSNQLEAWEALSETLTEVGNILLNACLGVFDNLLGVPVTFAVPVLSVAPVEHVLHRVLAGDAATDALLVRTRIEVLDCSTWGHLVIMPRPASLEVLIRKLALWETGPNRANGCS